MTQQINLYQDQFRRRRQPLDTVQMLLGLAALVVVLSLWAGYDYWRATSAEARLEAARDRHAAVEDQVADLRDRLEQARREVERNGELVRLQEETQAKERLLEYLEEGPLAERDGFSPYLEGLARQTIDDLWLRRIVFRDGGQRLRLDGHALAPHRVPALIAALGEESAYRGHAFRTLTIDRSEEHVWRIDFTLASDARDEGNGRGRSR